MVNFDFPIVNFPYLSSNIPESPELLTPSGTPAFTTFGEFMISHIHCIQYRIGQSIKGLCLGINDFQFGLFVCLD